MRRAIERKVEDVFSEDILRRHITNGDHVKVRIKDGHLFFDLKKAEPPKEEEKKEEKEEENEKEAEVKTETTGDSKDATESEST